MSIRLIGGFSGISAGHLAAMLHFHPSTLTGVLERLERRGLIVRRRDGRDGRRATLVLSAAGRSLDGRRSGTIESAVRTALAAQRPEDVTAARVVLAGMTARLLAWSSRRSRDSRCRKRTGNRQATSHL